MVLSKHFLEGASITVADNDIASYLLEIERQIWAEYKQDTVEVAIKFEFPDGWWQMFKKQYFPDWLLNKYPVVYKTHVKYETKTVEWINPAPEYDMMESGMQRLHTPNSKARIKTW